MIRAFYKMMIASTIALGAQSASAGDDTTLRQIDAELAKSEATFVDIVEGTEKYVRWHQQERHVTPFSIVYLHGFSATRQELDPLVDQLADRLGANVFYTRLTGHGRSEDAMLEGNVDAWKNDTLQAFRIGHTLGDKVIVIGTSTGGTLATWLAAQSDAQNLYANILISPNFGVKSRSAGMMRWRLGLWLAKKLNGDYYSFVPQNEFHAKFWTERYPMDALVPMLDLVDDVADLDKSVIRAPHLIVYSPRDIVVDVDDIKDTADELINARVDLLEFNISKDPAQHVLVGLSSSPDEVGDMLTLIETFLESLAN